MGDDRETEPELWEVCFSSPIDAEAHIVCGYLEHHGVPCHLRSTRFGMEPLTFGALGQVDVLVPNAWGRVARGMIRGRLADATRPNGKKTRKDDPDEQAEG